MRFQILSPLLFNEYFDFLLVNHFDFMCKHSNNFFEQNKYSQHYWLIIDLVSMNNFSSDQQDTNYNKNEKIVIGLVQWRGRKHLTQIKNIPKQFDLERICKYWRKKLKCGGKVEQVEGTKKKQIKLNGDHRQFVEEFLVYMGIGEKENIIIQGKTNN